MQAQRANKVVTQEAYKKAPMFVKETVIKRTWSKIVENAKKYAKTFDSYREAKKQQIEQLKQQGSQDYPYQPWINSGVKQEFRNKMLNILNSEEE